MNSTISLQDAKSVRTDVDFLNILYVGKSKEFHERIWDIEMYKSVVAHFENPLLAYKSLQDENRKYDVIFCDSDLKGIDVISYTDEIQKVLINKPIIVLLNSRLSSKHSLKNLRNHGIDDIIEFPESSMALSLKLSFLLKNKDSKLKAPSTHSKESSINFSKRLFDIVFSLLALICLSPILILAALAIKIDSKGPVFFISKRVGQGYKIFDFYKFRSMKTGAENLIDNLKGQNQYQTEAVKPVHSCNKCQKLGHNCSPLLIVDGKEICENLHKLQKANNQTSFLKFKNDPRVTKLGEFLRRSSIDELPQLINILKGDMSFVGNRPLPLYEAEQLTSDQWGKRFLAPAGLTGLWQVTKRGKADMSEEERKELDNEYAKNHSFIGDIILILKTFPALTQKENV